MTVDVELIEKLPFQSGNFCRVYECDSFPALGRLQVLIMADRLPDDDTGTENPCLVIKTTVKGAIISANNAFQDSEEGEVLRDKILENLTPEKAKQLLTVFEVKKMLTLINESILE